VVLLERLDARGERPGDWIGANASAARVLLAGAAVGLVALGELGWWSLVAGAALLVGGLAGIAAVERRAGSTAG
jgi:hypothetical protein